VRPRLRRLIALLKRTPNPFVEELEHRVMLAPPRPGACSSPPAFPRTSALAAYARLMQRFANMVGQPTRA